MRYYNTTHYPMIWYNKVAAINDALSIALARQRASYLCHAFYDAYTRSPLQDSRLFGPSPWKILRHYLWEMGSWATQPLAKILRAGILLWRPGVPVVCTGRAAIQVDANGAPMRQRGCAVLYFTSNYGLKTRKHMLVMYCMPPLYCTVMYFISLVLQTRPPNFSTRDWIVYIPQRGVQWKQGVVIYMMLHTSLLHHTTPIRCTPLRVPPPVMNTQNCADSSAAWIGRGETGRSPELYYIYIYIYTHICIDTYIHTCATRRPSTNTYIHTYIHTYRKNTRIKQNKQTNKQRATNRANIRAAQ